MKLNQKLIDAAKEQMNTRFPNQGGLAAAAYTSDGEIQPHHWIKVYVKDEHENS